jgi:lipopolysaccharide export system protein LptA
MFTRYLSRLGLIAAMYFIAIPSLSVAYAEKADQDKPIVLEATKVSGNDVQQTYELDGEVLITKGSILMTGEKVKIKVDPEGYEYVDVRGLPGLIASFRQRREGPADEFMQGNGEVITYNAKTELLTLTGNASLKRLLNMQMLDQVFGNIIQYDDIKQSYRVTAQSKPKPGDPPLTRAILSPRQKATLEK